MSKLQALTNDERALIEAFRQCDARGKYATLACVKNEAEESPKPRPHLTLVPTAPKPTAGRSAAKGQ